MTNPNPAAYTVPGFVILRRWLLRTIFRGVFHALVKVKLVGWENIPSQGPYIIAHNHIALFEPPFILAFWPIAPEAVAGADVFYRPWQSLLVRGYAAIPVHRDQYDRQVVEKMLQLLSAGRSLMIAPEGGRSHDLGLRRARPGVAYIMDRAKVPVLPVGVVGSTDDMLARAFQGNRPTLEMRVGKPFMLPAIEGKGETRRASRQENADAVMRQVAALLPAEFHGVYAGQVVGGGADSVG